MIIRQVWDRTELEHYLLYDGWEDSDALYFLAGFWSDGKVYKPLDMEAFTDFVFSDEDRNESLSAMRTNLKALQKLWDSNFLKDTIPSPPSEWIEWAISKRRPPAWLDWAISKELYTPKEPTNKPTSNGNRTKRGKKLHTTIQNTPAAPEFDPASPTYPSELVYALAAWRAVSTTEGKGKPKARIKAWLNTNTTLSDKAKERIAVVCNWEKLGGATTTE